MVTRSSSTGSRAPAKRSCSWPKLAEKRSTRPNRHHQSSTRKEEILSRRTSHGIVVKLSQFSTRWKQASMDSEGDCEAQVDGPTIEFLMQIREGLPRNSRGPTTTHRADPPVIGGGVVVHDTGRLPNHRRRATPPDHAPRMIKGADNGPSNPAPPIREAGGRPGDQGRL